MPHNFSQPSFQYNPMNFNNYGYNRGSSHDFSAPLGSPNPSLNSYNQGYPNNNSPGANGPNTYSYSHNGYHNSNGYYSSSHGNNTGNRGNSRMKNGSQKPHYKNNRFHDSNHSRKSNPSYSPHHQRQPDYSMAYQVPYGGYAHFIPQMSCLPPQPYLEEDHIPMYQPLFTPGIPQIPHMQAGHPSEHMMSNEYMIPQPSSHYHRFNGQLDEPPVMFDDSLSPESVSEPGFGEFVRTGGNFASELPWLSVPEKAFPKRQFIRKHREKERLKTIEPKEIEIEAKVEVEVETETETSKSFEVKEELKNNIQQEGKKHDDQDKPISLADSSLPKEPIATAENIPESSVESPNFLESASASSTDVSDVSTASSNTSPASSPPSTKSWAEKLKASPSKSPTSPQKKAITAKPTAPANGDPSKQSKSPAANGHSLSSQQSLLPNKNAIKKDPIGVVLAAFDYEKVKKEYSHNNIVRGIGNTGNICFMNSILQVLMHCPPFFKLLEYIKQNSMFQIKSETPLMDAIIELSRELCKPHRRETEALQPSTATEVSKHPISPEAFYSVMRNQPPFKHYKRGHQEDAEEFLGHLLESLHDEFLAAMKSSASLIEAKKKEEEEINGTSSSNEDSNEWLEVGKNNKEVTIQQNTGFGKTPISQLFAGNLRSTLNIPSKKPSITREPFQQIQLDISDSDVHSIEDALINLAKPEKLQYSISADQEVCATKQLLIDDTPEILVAHLKRFSYTADDQGYPNAQEQVRKISKPISYPSQLQIPREAVTAAVATPELPLYTLCGVIYHHGPSATSGHYTADIKTVGDDGKEEWINVDDIMLNKISLPNDLAPNKPRSVVAGSMASVLANKNRNKPSASSSSSSSPAASAGTNTPTAASVVAGNSDKSGSTKTAYILFYTKNRSNE